MKKRRNILIGIMFGLLAVLLVLILSAAFLTSGKELDELNAGQLAAFIACIIGMTASLVGVFIVADKVGKLNVEINPQMRQPISKQENKLMIRSFLLLIVSFLASCAVILGGVKIAETAAESLFDLACIMFCVSIALALICLVLNILLKKRYIKKINDQSVAQMQQMLISQREQVQTERESKLLFLRRWRILTNVYSAFIVVLGVAAAASFGLGRIADVKFAVIPSTLLIFIGISRIHFRIPTAFMDEDDEYVPKEEFPYLYELAEKAKKTILDDGHDIRIRLQTEENIGIAEISNTYSLALGIILVSMLTEEELYCILLHEFSHIKNSRADDSKKENDHINWLSVGRAQTPLYKAADKMYGFFDVVYAYGHMLYSYATAVMIESEADKSMLLYGKKYGTL